MTSTRLAPWCFDSELIAQIILGDWGAYHVIKVACIVSTQKANRAALFTVRYT